MKTYNLEEIKELSKNSKNYIYDDDNENKVYSIEEFDKAKTRILKYIFYKKRTESEVRKKFYKEYKEEIIDDVIEDLKENGYINDENYITRAIDEFIALKNLSIREVKYKLIAKGINSNDIDTYIDNNYDRIMEYEKQSAKNIINKKSSQMEPQDIKIYLMKKGYREESIKENF
ncbi:MAG: RecX family transcriptional regulator [Clostridia bacterium]|nr:RecX family transcriptional regulator [Clostridia bacterium]